MVNLPTPQSRIEELMNAFITRDLSRVVTPQSRIEEFWYNLIEGTNSLPIPQSRVELLLKKIIENDTKETPLARSRIEEFLIAILTGEIDNLPIPQSRSEEYLNYIATNNNVIDEDIEYLAYTGTNITAHNTVEKPIRSAILKGKTGYRDKDTGEILEIFEEGRNLELVSVRMPVLTTVGKNLNPTSIEPLGLYDSTGANNNNSTHCRTDDFINVTPNKVLTVSSDHQINRVFGYDTDGNYLGMGNGGIIVSYGFADKKQHTFTVPNNCHKIKITSFVNTNTYFQLEEGTTATNYEPFKSNILHTPEEVVLRSLPNGVKDTLNLMTGEYVRRIGEMTFQNQTGWQIASGYPNLFYYNYDNIGNANIYVPSNVVPNLKCDKLPVVSYEMAQQATSGIKIANRGKQGSHSIAVYNANASSVSELTAWLSQNPFTIQYELATPVIKTVDLKVVDQDGNPVNQLSAFDSTTHIISGSESDNSLIAIAEVEVPTKVIDGLSDAQRLSTEVDESCIVVQTLQDNQDINSTLAMTAITELYELALEGGEL